jgi:hypothetical protein
MNFFCKRLEWSGKKPEEGAKTKTQRLSARLFSPTYLVSVGVLLFAATPTFKGPVDRFNDGALGTLTTYVRQAKAPDWRKHFALPHWAKAMHI